MAFTEATSITEIRALLNEPSPSYWSDTEITNWLKQGCLDWTEKSLLLIKDDTIALVNSQYQYTTSTNSFITNAVRTLHAEYNNRALQRVNFEQLRGHNAVALSSDKTPKHYYDQYNGTTFTFYVAPTPSGAEGGNNVTVQFACKTDDITEIPYEYQQVIFLFVVSRAKIKERQHQEATAVWQQYINNIMFSRKDSLEHGIQPIDTFRIK